MSQWQCCRTCLSVENLHPIFGAGINHEKYIEVVLEATGVQIGYNDSLPQLMCANCINVTNDTYTFRMKCQETQKCISEQFANNYEVKTEGSTSQSDVQSNIFIDISRLIDDDDDNIPECDVQFDEELSKSETHEKCVNTEEKKLITGKKIVKRTVRAKNKEKHNEKEEIVCEYCQKVLTSKLSLRNHYKIHTGFDIVCEHCGKKFITRRLLLMHCKAKHGYEKTDKCSFCDYRASNAEQVKIHERLHTGEKPYVCSVCGAGFHRKSSHLQHVAIHLPEKTVQCTQCPARFKSTTLMRIHLNRHRPAQYTYKCVVCGHTFARRRNVVRHIGRIHALQPRPDHVARTRCDQPPPTKIHHDGPDTSIRSKLL